MMTPQDLRRRLERGKALAAHGNERDRPAIRVAVLCSFNVEWIAPLLVEAIDRYGHSCEFWIGPFGQIAQVILDPDSGLDSFGPDFLAIIPAAEDLLAPLFQRPGADSANVTEQLISCRIDELRHWLGVLLDRLPKTTTLIVPFGAGRVPGPGVLRPRDPARGQAALACFVEAVRGLDDLSPRVAVVDWDWHASAVGWDAMHDERLWYLARMRLNQAGLAELAELLARHIAAVRGMVRKVVVVDLDNTLWGGVVGETGVDGLILGNEGLGLAFQDFQRELLKWYDAGTLLAVCSKNNPEDALEAIDRHPGCILRREHFAAMRIDWQDKAAGIRAIADELGLGLDSFVFLDDNPVERGWVADALPEVLVPELPADPADRPAFLRAAPFALRLSPTEADRSRAGSYRAAGERDRWKAQAATLEEFLGSLRLEVEIAPLRRDTLARAAQMCQRTNQFNLTARRYTTAELEGLLADATCEAFTLSVRDRFEDSGITGFAILRRRGDARDIDTFLLSCRVLGRRVEDALLAFLVDNAREGGADRLVGRYTPTVKNRQVANFYPDRGFQPVEEGIFVLGLRGEEQLPTCPPQIALVSTSGGPR